MPRVRTLLAMTGAAVLGVAMLGGPSAQAADADMTYQVIANVFDPSQVLDARAEGTESGTEIWTYSHHSGQNQLWSLQSWPNGTVGIVGKQSGRCITPTGPGGGLVLRDCEPYQRTQRWYRIYRPDGSITFENDLLPGQCLALGQYNNRAVLAYCDGYDTQNWRVRSA
ncbi:RICIN domain-containing protein [Goodfellowiella coeruleoviolacea]|uniref:Ricin-type beta-trefoil lectin domain-containing protein n=1 Tax=Goodfellowiella coeruleoviolacea TaxID=334858 RepID=A0AAE3GKN9_9PSEU|nr:RICIN domain-containing protein [Goodfellowiella coeruleoviolacea]MCP2169245.1 Ricin-type beta-trefoil lectin domain-containing protein [Goodfellowiella coeruleoviolacea]